MVKAKQPVAVLTELGQELLPEVVRKLEMVQPVPELGRRAVEQATVLVQEKAKGMGIRTQQRLVMGAAVMAMPRQKPIRQQLKSKKTIKKPTVFLQRNRPLR